ncbi:MAG: DUF1330 domain-containing protein [Bradyrhizobium sp.]|uniref:DUF1330 domain-containing protein n=1 Tax=Bradyrhizobium sp. TaxID=376 RepID=UPI00120BE81D|nr:DUF1330 domain-containing protein [Bradyrhizobium sp.]THD72177.1 MAG: DUF1330 domain-containing protein [Bradyrhizobium sp.]
MKTHVKLGLAMVAGFGLGAGAVHELHAQASPPAYVISEIDVVDESGYSNDYIPLVKKALAGSGEKRIVSGGNTLAIAGDPPKSRVVVSVFENMDKAQAVFTSQAYQDAQTIGEKYAKFRTFAVEGTAP